MIKKLFVLLAVAAPLATPASAGELEYYARVTASFRFQ